MSEETEFRITHKGPEASREQLFHELRKLEGQAERKGVEVTVERVTRVEASEDLEFKSGNDS